MPLYVDLKKSLGKFQLEVQFESDREILALLGASGCGKSMTLKCIAGIEKPDSGQIVLDGRVLFDSEKKINLSPQKRKTGYLFQNYALFPHMTVEENIAAGIPLPKAEKEKIIREKIAAFYLCGLEKHYPSQLSGGQQQRVAIARMLASRPEILMLDEPFSALDSYLKWQLEQEMRKVLREYGGTALFVSHNRDEVYRICDRVAVLDDGRIDIISGKWELFRHPKTRAAGLLTGCKNFSRAVKRGEHRIEAVDWGTELTCADPVPDSLQFVGFRAHYFLVSDCADQPNTIACEVLDVVEDTFSVIVLLQNRLSGEQTPFSRLRLEIGKEKWREIESDGGLRYVSFPQDKLLLLVR